MSDLLTRRSSRRAFLKTSLLVGLTVPSLSLLAACGSPAQPAPTAAPAKPAESKPAESKPAEAAKPAAPAAQPAATTASAPAVIADA